MRELDNNIITQDISDKCPGKNTKAVKGNKLSEGMLEIQLSLTKAIYTVKLKYSM